MYSIDGDRLSFAIVEGMESQVVDEKRDSWRASQCNMYVSMLQSSQSHATSCGTGEFNAPLRVLGGHE